MKNLLTILLFFLPLLTVGQVKNPPTLTYRAGNSNELTLRLSRAGVTLTPSASLTIAAEVRLSDQGKALVTLPFAQTDTSSVLRVVFPVSVVAGNYILGLLIQQTGQADYRTGLANMQMMAIGSLQSIASTQGLIVSILPQTTQPISVTTESTSSLVAYYNQQVQTAKTHIDSVRVLVESSNGVALSGLYSFTQSQNQRDNSQDASISGKADKATTLAGYGITNAYTSVQVDNALAGKQNTLTFDTSPTTGSANPVTSGGVYTALLGKIDAILTTQTSDTTAAATGSSNKLIIEIISGTLTLYIYCPTASQTLSKILTY